MKAFQPVQDTVCLLAGVRPTRRTLPGEHFKTPEAGEARPTPALTLWARLTRAFTKKPVESEASALPQVH